MTSMTDSPRYDPDLHESAALVEALTGIRVPEYRRPLLHSELERLGGEWGVEGGIRRLVDGDSEARTALISSVSIPETYLFRHFGHFVLLRELACDRGAKGLPTRVLSAGCSTGEEAWSAAAILATVPKPADDDHVVLGWELCAERLKRARAGRFSTWSRRNGLKGYSQFFDPVGEEVAAGARLREVTAFQQVNLVKDEYPPTGVFDAVFLRNVAIYWGDETTRDVISKLIALLDDNGLLLVGPSDPVTLPRGDWDHLIRHGVRFYRRRTSKPGDHPPAPIPSIREAVRDREHPPAATQPARTPSTREGRTPAPSIDEVPPPAGTERRPSPAAEIELTDDPVQRCLARVKELADAGRYSEAASVLENDAAGTSVEGRLWRGILSLSSEHDHEAVRLFRQCVFLRPDVAEHHRWLGVALEAVGRSAEARRAHKTATELDEQ